MPSTNKYHSIKRPTKNMNEPKSSVSSSSSDEETEEYRVEDHTNEKCKYAHCMTRVFGFTVYFNVKNCKCKKERKSLDFTNCTQQTMSLTQIEERDTHTNPNCKWERSEVLKDNTTIYRFRIKHCDCIRTIQGNMEKGTLNSTYLTTLALTF